MLLFVMLTVFCCLCLCIVLFLLLATWLLTQYSNKPELNNDDIIQGASVNWAILQHCFFWFGNTGADAAVAILLPTLKRFSCNGAVDWSTMCFCFESVLQKRRQFCDHSE
jgi:hypothetical protein